MITGQCSILQNPNILKKCTMAETKTSVPVICNVSDISRVRKVILTLRFSVQSNRNAGTPYYFYFRIEGRSLRRGART